MRICNRSISLLSKIRWLKTSSSLYPTSRTGKTGSAIESSRTGRTAPSSQWRMLRGGLGRAIGQLLAPDVVAHALILDQPQGPTPRLDSNRCGHSQGKGGSRLSGLHPSWEACPAVPTTPRVRTKPHHTSEPRNQTSPHCTKHCRIRSNRLWYIIMPTSNISTLTAKTWSSLKVPFHFIQPSSRIIRTGVRRGTNCQIILLVTSKTQRASTKTPNPTWAPEKLKSTVMERLCILRYSNKG